MRAETFPRLWTPLIALVQRFAYGALLVASMAIIIIGKADVSLVERLRVGVGDAMAPLMIALTRPVAAATGALSTLHDMTSVYRENERLKEENATLLQWQQVARRLDNENLELRKITNYVPGGNTWFVTGRVIGAAGGSYSRSVMIDRGSADGISKGQAATSGTGLVGRIAEVGARASRVLLVTDMNSRIPVILQGSHERAVLAGDNSDWPLLAYLAPNAKIAVGDQVVTSGDGGVLPPGIPIGTVASIGGYARVALSTDLSTVDYLRIVDFGLSGLLPPSAVPAPKAAKPSADKAKTSNGAP